MNGNKEGKEEGGEGRLCLVELAGKNGDVGLIPLGPQTEGCCNLRDSTRPQTAASSGSTEGTVFMPI